MANKTASELYKVKLTGPGVAFDRAVSEAVASTIINLIMTGASAALVPAFPPAGTPGGIPGGAPVVPNQPLPRVTTAKQFMALKRPSNFYQRIACLAYYLAHFENTPTFKTRDISNVNTAAAEPKLTNAAAFVRDATSKYRYLSSAGGSRKQITTFGETIVDALPDQEKVKALHADNAPRSSRRNAARKRKNSR